MEQEKDMIKKDIISGTEKGTQQLVSGVESVFINTRERSIKMAAALHLVTELFSETESIRSALRTEAVTLTTISATQTIFKEAVENKTFGDVLETIRSLVTVLHTSNLLSDMNTEILLREIAVLSDSTKHFETKNNHVSGVILQELFLEKNDPLQQAVQRSDVAVITDSFMTKVVTEDSIVKRHGSILAQTKKTTTNIKPTIQISSFKKSPLEKKTGRKKNILNAIRSNGSSIKDIAKAVRGCSEKTIQRELNTLIAEGLVVREGEKRWSVYKKS